MLMGSQGHIKSDKPTTENEDIVDTRDDECGSERLVDVPDVAFVMGVVEWG